ncbi:hypothetical protein C2G38_2033783 [Gigaspora rosea]|uniref:BTB domain-containing protein n=1 Tax=Gigaspora rosea TaxID=44941 RepID=A0A397VLI5_9GLOM|nr:hypothetical protein C2G38_2033783 [Gigaspora rosea]
MTINFFEQLASNLNELLKNSNEYNVIIEVGKGPDIQAFKVHSIILNSRCLYFKDKLDTITYNGNNVKTIKQPNLSIEVFDIIIKYIYRGTISLENINASVIFELLIVSNEFRLDVLIKHVQLFLLENNASWKNLDSTIKWGIAQNPSLPLNPDRWSDEDFLTLKSSLQNCLPFIRYFQISGEDIFNKIRPYQKILDPNLWADIMLKFMAPNSPITSRVLPPRVNLPSTLPSRDNGIPITDNDLSEVESNKASELRKSGETYCITEIEPNNAFALRSRGNSYRFISRYNESLADLNKSLEIKPDDAFTLRSRGDTYRMMNRYVESLADLNESLEIEPKSAFALRIRGNTYHMMRRYNESLADLNKSLEIEPNSAFALKIRGDTYRIMNRYVESLADLNKSLEIVPNNAFAFRMCGNTYHMMGRYNESLADLNKSLEIEPDDAFALKCRGATYCMMRRYEESFADLNKSLEIDPNNSWALEEREKTNRFLKK